jgi:uncharacterized protein (TIGR00255 family)
MMSAETTATACRYSMTAYGSSRCLAEVGNWSVEIQSVNRKGLDVVVQLPKYLFFLDPVIRKLVGEVTERGSVTVRVQFEFSTQEDFIGLLKRIQQKWQKVAELLGFDSKVVDFRFLMERVEEENFSFNEELLKKDFNKSWSLALRNWISMKERKGKFLIGDIEKRIEKIVVELKCIENLHPVVLEKYYNRIKNRMKDISIDESSVLKEIAILVDKADITEEVVRLQSHIKQMHRYFLSEDRGVGRTLDFLAQEMHREIGTLLAKAGDVSMTERAIVIKSEVEKIRELVQNIE